MQRLRFKPPLSLQQRGYFPLELIWFLTPLPKTLSDESINQGLVCAHMHSITRTSKILTFMSLTGECWQQKHAQHAPSTRTKCDYLNGWIKNGYIHKNLTKTGEPQRSSCEHRTRTRRVFFLFCFVFLRSPAISLGFTTFG